MAVINMTKIKLIQKKLKRENIIKREKRLKIKELKNIYNKRKK